MTQTLPWSSPTAIEAEVRRLQAAVREAGSRAEALGPGPDTGPRDGFREAVGTVAAATRALVDYESAIPALQQGYRQHVSTLITRWSGGLLTVFGTALGALAALGALPLWWVSLALALAAAGLATLPGSARRCADPLVRPRLGAACFATAGILTGLCALKVLPPGALLVVFAACWVGLYAFRLLGTGAAREETA